MVEEIRCLFYKFAQTDGTKYDYKDLLVGSKMPQKRSVRAQNVETHGLMLGLN